MLYRRLSLAEITESEFSSCRRSILEGIQELKNLLMSKSSRAANGEKL
jgi:hypothetical protein